MIIMNHVQVSESVEMCPIILIGYVLIVLDSQEAEIKALFEHLDTLKNLNFVHFDDSDPSQRPTVCQSMAKRVKVSHVSSYYPRT
jgi:hypothetical protein